MDDEAALRRWLRWTLVALFVAVAMLVGTGVWLVVNYRPSASAPLLPIDDQTRWMIGWVTRVRRVHRFAAWLAVFLGGALLVEAAIDAVWRRRVRIALSAIPVPALTVVGFLTGAVLPWSLVALRAVTVGADVSGYGVAFGDRARFFLVDGGRMAPDELRSWFWVHTTVVPGVLLALLVTTTLLVARTRPALASPAGTDVDVTGS